MVLDLGCGSGFWAIEAAKQWQVRRYSLHSVVFPCTILAGFNDNWLRHCENPTPTQRHRIYEADCTTH